MQLVQSLLASVAVFAAAVVAEYETEDSVLVLGEKDFHSAIKEFSLLLAEFYAPWCGHCKKLAPEYAEAAKYFDEFENIRLAKVDATVHTELAAQYGVSGYPTIKLFKEGSIINYEGGRLAQDIISWMLTKDGPSVVADLDAAAIEALKEAHPVVVVLYTTDTSDESKIMKHYKGVADKTDEVKFVVISDDAVAKELDINENSVALFKAYDDGRANFSDKITQESLEDFIEPHLLPLVVEFSENVVQRVFGGKIRSVMLYFRKDADSDADKAILDEYRRVAKEHHDELHFVAVNMDSSDNLNIAEFFGLSSDSDYPDARIIDIQEDPTKYKAPEGFEFNEAGFELFASKYLNGELQQSLNTEDTPEDWDAEELKVVVGVNFEEVVLDEKKNVFLLAHAPWCGHCKSIMPVMEDLADHFEEDDDVVIVKMDATKNEVKEFSVQSFPTLKFFPAGGAPMIDYDGGRELDDFIEFIDSNRVDAEDDEDKDEL